MTVKDEEHPKNLSNVTVRLEFTKPRRWKPTRTFIRLCVAFFSSGKNKTLFILVQQQKWERLHLHTRLASRHPLLINFSKLLLGPEVFFNRKLNCILQAVYRKERPK